MDASFELVDTYALQGRYTELRKVLAPVPMSGKWGQAAKEVLAETEFTEKANTAASRAVTPEKRADSSVPRQRVKLALFDQDPDQAEKALEGVSPGEFSPLQPRPYWEGAIALLRSDRVAMLPCYDVARGKVAKALEKSRKTRKPLPGWHARS